MLSGIDGSCVNSLAVLFVIPLPQMPTKPHPISKKTLKMIITTLVDELVAASDQLSDSSIEHSSVNASIPMYGKRSYKLHVSLTPFTQ